MQDHIENRAYAGFFPRWIAYMIDCVIAFIVGGIIKIPFGLAAGAGLNFLKANFIFQYSFIDVIGYLGMVSYFVLLTYFGHTTLGKALLRLEVITDDDEWTFVNILYRETVGRFLSGLLCIGYLAIIATEKCQGFHDMLCDTYVVYKNMHEDYVPVRSKASVNVRPAMADGPGMPVSPYVSTPVQTMNTPDMGTKPFVGEVNMPDMGTKPSAGELNTLDMNTTKAGGTESEAVGKGEPIVSAFIMPGEGDNNRK